MTFLASALVSAGLYAQCYKIFRTKSSKDFNPLLVAAMSVGQIVSLNYGLAIGEWPIITISSLNLAPVTLIAIGCCHYRKRGAKYQHVDRGAGSSRRTPTKCLARLTTALR